MYPDKHLEVPGNSPTVSGSLRLIPVLLVAMLVFCAIPSPAQSNGGNSGTPQQQSQPNQSQQDQMPAAAGGPTGESGPIAVPKKAEGEEPPPPPKPHPADVPQFSLHVDVPLVTVDAQVLMKDGRTLNMPIDRKSK